MTYAVHLSCPNSCDAAHNCCTSDLATQVTHPPHSTIMKWPSNKSPHSSRHTPQVCQTLSMNQRYRRHYFKKAAAIGVARYLFGEGYLSPKFQIGEGSFTNLQRCWWIFYQWLGTTLRPWGFHRAKNRRAACPSQLTGCGSQRKTKWTKAFKRKIPSFPGPTAHVADLTLYPRLAKR